MKKHLAAALVAAAIPALWVAPAGAAVPAHGADVKLACGKKVAKVWVTKKLAVDNQCKDKWVVLSWGEGPSFGTLSVAPGAHFNRGSRAPGATFEIRAELADHVASCAPNGSYSVAKSQGGKQNPVPCQQ